MNRKGFTLVEIIFSIAFLSLVSVIMLQLLITSFEIENKTDTIEIANVFLINEIERLKSLNLDDLKDVDLNYTESWEPTNKENSHFNLRVYLVELEPGLYKLLGQVIEDEVLLNITTKHYYHDKE